MKNPQATAAFNALGHEARLNIFRLIVQRAAKGVTPSEIVELLGIPAATLSFHLKELANAGLIQATRDGRQLIYRPQFQFVNELVGFLSENCCSGEPCAITVALPTRKKVK
jgi:ArsR family transcriptional regulator, arsenate/arsenite/antimonite-responsive transcriptional repressor